MIPTVEAVRVRYVHKSQPDKFAFAVKSCPFCQESHIYHCPDGGVEMVVSAYCGNVCIYVMSHEASMIWNSDKRKWEIQ